MGDAAVKTAIKKAWSKSVQHSRHQSTKAKYGSTHVTLQAVVYDICPPTTAIVDYARALERLSANEQFFDGAQTAISL